MLTSCMINRQILVRPSVCAVDALYVLHLRVQRQQALVASDVVGWLTGRSTFYCVCTNMRTVLRGWCAHRHPNQHQAQVLQAVCDPWRPRYVRVVEWSSDYCCYCHKTTETERLRLVCAGIDRNVVRLVCRLLGTVHKRLPADPQRDAAGTAAGAAARRESDAHVRPRLSEQQRRPIEPRPSITESKRSGEWGRRMASIVQHPVLSFKDSLDHQPHSSC